MDMGRKSELLEKPNGVPVDVDLIPLQPVSGRDRVRVMVVMPPISETQHSYDVARQLGLAYLGFAPL